MAIRHGNKFENITSAEKSDIVVRYASGDSIDTITAQQQYGERLVYRVLHEAGVSLHKAGGYTKYRALDPTNSKVCTRCLIEKPKADFLNKSTGTGLRAECKDCSAIRGRETVLKRLGLTVEDYDNMLSDQRGVCACCGQPETYSSGGGAWAVKALAVDHDHKTGKSESLFAIDAM